MSERTWIAVEEALALHAVLVARHGGAVGLRDPGALASALDRPRNGYYDDVVAEAAALLESLAINHPFLDGNKRIAFAVTDCFLRLNGWRLMRDPLRIHAEWMDLFAQGSVDWAHLEPWLRAFAVASAPPTPAAQP